jgi:polysaccharide export outer membrane protein
VVALDAATADRLAAIDAPNLHSFAGGGTGALGTGGAADLRIGTGDTVIVSIYEAASGGLFSGDASAAGGSKSISLPPQPVARNGTVSVPYVGQVKVAGLTPAQVQAAIEAGLKDKAIEPQVLVTVASSASTFVTVAGDVGQPGRVPLNLGGDRILDVIAGAGGSKAPAYDSFVRLTRGGRTVTVSLAAIVDDPRQNIYLRPDDQVYLVTDPQIYTAFGATARNASFPFETDRLTLAEAVGRAGGLNDNRANPRGVFVFRYEDPQAYALVRQSGATPAAYAQAPAGSRSGSAAGIPVIYELNLREPQSLFAAQRFLMRDNDILYVSNAPSTDLQKVFGTISGGVGTGLSASRLSTTIID